MKIRTYSELIKFNTFEDRYNYLKLSGIVGEETFGWSRYLNQKLYHDERIWKRIRDEVITRDLGCDLGLEGYEILGKIIIHHMNPITKVQIEKNDPMIYDPEYLITVSHNTHNGIHYGKNLETVKVVLERSKNDTCPWRN